MRNPINCMGLDRDDQLAPDQSTPLVQYMESVMAIQLLLGTVCVWAASIFIAGISSKTAKPPLFKTVAIVGIPRAQGLG
jgi:hypothetical protein